MAETDQVARLKMLTIIALAESEDGRWDPDGVKLYLGQISTEDLQKMLAATRYCIIELHIVKELGTRKDITAEKLMELLSTTEHAAVQKALCEAAAAIHATRKAPLRIEEINSMSASGVTGPIKEAIEYTLLTMPRGSLPGFFAQARESVRQLVLNELKRRNDPIGEELLQLLDINLTKDTQEAIVAMIRHDPRITPDHLFAIHNSEMVRRVLYEKLKDASLEAKKVWYKDAKEAVRTAIITSCEDDLRKLSDMTETTAFLIDHAGTPAVHTTIIRILGKHIPIKQLLELRERTTNKDAIRAFATLFGERYHELQKFLASL